jgi:hypothetical protein
MSNAETTLDGLSLTFYSAYSQVLQPPLRARAASQAFCRARCGRAADRYTTDHSTTIFIANTILTPHFSPDFSPTTSTAGRDGELPGACRASSSRHSTNRGGGSRKKDSFPRVRGLKRSRSRSASNGLDEIYWAAMAWAPK